MDPVPIDDESENVLRTVTRVRTPHSDRLGRPSSLNTGNERADLLSAEDGTMDPSQQVLDINLILIGPYSNNGRV